MGELQPTGDGAGRSRHAVTAAAPVVAWVHSTQSMRPGRRWERREGQSGSGVGERGGGGGEGGEGVKHTQVERW